MTQAKTGEGRKKIYLIFLVLLIIGIVGYFTLRGHRAFYLLAHIGALGVLGLLGVSAGLIACRKGYNFKKSFLLGFLVPIILGIVAVFAVRYLGGEGTPFYCGGSVCLAAALLIIVGYSIVRKNKDKVT